MFIEMFLISEEVYLLWMHKLYLVLLFYDKNSKMGKYNYQEKL